MQTSQKTALIFGVSGQDGAYLSRLLLDKGYRVIGASRDAGASRFENLHRLGVFDEIETVTVAPADYVIATGESNTLETFLATAFENAGLDWHDHVETDPTLTRPTDLAVGRANTAKAVHENHDLFSAIGLSPRPPLPVACIVREPATVECRARLG